MHNLQNTKSTVARLLAGENLNIVYDNSARTASFDPQSRTIFLPVWEDVSEDLADLLHSHEAGHAIDTPAEGWHNEIKSSPGFKSILNIVEDARIEKRQKRRYPGLARPMARGYKELYDRDFFGINKLQDLSKLNLADRINLYFKLGSLLIIPFNDAERQIVADVAAAETWDDVVRIAKILSEHIKENEKEKINSANDLKEQIFEDLVSSDDDEDSNSVDSDMGNDSYNESDLNFDDDSSDAKENNQKQGSNSDSSDEPDSQIVNDDNDPQSVTDQIFREREEQLLAVNCEVFAGDFPQPILDNIIISNKQQLEKFELYYHYAEVCSNIDVASMKKTCLDMFNKKNMSYVSLLLKEFEMRKNAKQYARSQTSRTGDIDMSKLHKYKFSNDIFRKITVVPKGKSHGLVLFLDMSGSMFNDFTSTIEQLMILGVFCKKANIPFDFYGFSDSGSKNDLKRFESDKFRVRAHGFKLIHLLSSSSSSSDFRKSMEMMSIVAYNSVCEKFDVFNKDGYGINLLTYPQFNFKLNGTPFIETLLASREIIDNFKNDKKVDIVNVLYLTDGEGNSAIEYNDSAISGLLSSWAKKSRRIIMNDKKTKKQFVLRSSPTQSDSRNLQTKLTEFIRDLTGCKHIGYYITGSLQRADIADITNGNSEDFKVYNKAFNTNNFLEVKKLGYDKYYIVKGNYSAKVVNETLVIGKSMTNAQISKQFKSSMSSKTKNRMLISKFASEIADA